MRLGPRVRSAMMLWLGVAVGALAALYLRPHPRDVPSPWYAGPTPAERALSRRASEVNLTGQTFEQAVARLSRIWNVPIDLEWPAVERAGRGRGAVVSFKARDASLEECFSYLLAPRDESKALAFDCRGGGIVITSAAEQIRFRHVVRAYDIADFLEGPNAIIVEETPVFDGPMSRRQTGVTSARQERTASLVRLIQETVDPDTWRDNGGSVGSIHVLGNRMVVGQTASNQRQVGELLGALRYSPAPLPADDAPGPTSPNLKVWDDRVRQYVAPDGSAAERALRERRADVELIDASFAEALVRLAELWSAPIHAEPDVRPEPRVTLRLRDVTLRDALNATLRSAAGNRLVYDVKDGVIAVYDPARSVRLETKTYDLRAWLRDLGYADADGRPTNADRAGRDRFLDAVVATIQRTVTPDEWRDNGGSRGAIRYLGATLIVTAARETHDGVDDLLAAMRLDGVTPTRAAATRPAPGGGDGELK